MIGAIAAEVGAPLSHIARLCEDMLEWQHSNLARRYAVTRMGIAESDVRSIDGRTIRLWNRRRILLDDGYDSWAADQVIGSVRTALTVEAATGIPLPPLSRYGIIMPAPPASRLRRLYRKLFRR